MALVPLRVCGLLALLLLTSCLSVHAQSSKSASAAPLDISVCELAASPGNYDKRLIRIDAYWLRGFEESGLYDPSCPNEALPNMMKTAAVEPRIWAEFGDEAGYTKVTDYAPLVDNDQMRLLRRLLVDRWKIDQMTRANMVGTFYAGTLRKAPNEESFWMGFGHLGCCSLFVVSRVESVQADYSPELDYSPARWNARMPAGCYANTFLGLPTNEVLRQWQREANQGASSWRLDAFQVAEEQLRKLRAGEYGNLTGGREALIYPSPSKLAPPTDLLPVETLTEVSSSASVKTFEFHAKDRIHRYIITVNRPYWLERLAGPADKVIWVPAGSTLVECAAPKSRKK